MVLLDGLMSSGVVFYWFLVSDEFCIVVMIFGFCRRNVVVLFVNLVIIFG